MAWFLFAGDMLVMLFMTVLIVWLSLRGQGSANDFSAHIPLHDDVPVKRPVPRSAKSAGQGSDRHG